VFLVEYEHGGSVVISYVLALVVIVVYPIKMDVGSVGDTVHRELFKLASEFLAAVAVVGVVIDYFIEGSISDGLVLFPRDLLCVNR
jgi:hypothetical protein